MTYRKPVFVFGSALYGVGGCFLKPKNYGEFFTAIQSIRNGEFKFDEEALYAILQALDDAVTRSDVDFSQSKSWTEVALGGVPILRQFLVNWMQREKGGLATGSETRQMQ